jgi:hypothetical protein
VVRAKATVGGAAELHGVGVTRESLERRFGGRRLIESGLGRGGDDGEAIFGVSEARGGRGQARIEEERAAMLGAGRGERERGRSSNEGRMRYGMLWGLRGGFFRCRGGGEQPGEAEKWLAMVRSSNGFSHFVIEGGERRGWGGAPFREEEGRRRGRLGFLGCGGVSQRHRGSGYTGQRWWRLQPVVGCGVVPRRKKLGWPGGPLGPNRVG